MGAKPEVKRARIGAIHCLLINLRLIFDWDTSPVRIALASSPDS